MSEARTAVDTIRGVLLDTSFLIRLIKVNDPLHANARAWLKELLDRQVPLY